MITRTAFAALALSLLPTAAEAELAKLGPLALADTPKKSGFAKTTALGCAGSVRHEMKGSKVIAVELTTDDCKKAVLEAAIAKEYPGAPITSTDGEAKLWEGKTSSVILISAISQTVRLVLPGAGAKRTCFAEDGFSAFYTSFKEAVASNKADTIAASFAFPIKDVEHKVRIKDAKAFAKKWPKLIAPEDRKALAKEIRPSCSIGTETYEIRLSDSNASFTARKIGEHWLWTEINEESPG